MNKALLIGLISILVLLVISSLLAYRWNAENYPAWSRFIPQIKICHGGMPPSTDLHCHWVWETPHSHPQ